MFYDLNCSIAVTVLSNFSLHLRMSVLHKKVKAVSSCNVTSDCALVWLTWDDDICWQDSTSFLPVSSSQRGKRWLPSQQILNNVNLWSHEPSPPSLVAFITERKDCMDHILIVFVTNTIVLSYESKRMSL